MPRPAFLPALAVALLCSLTAVAPAVAQAPTPQQTLRQLFADEWERGLRDSPETASYQGDHRFDERWTDLSLPAIAAREAAERAALQRLRAIDRAALQPAEQLHYDTFEWQLQHAVERQRFREHLQPLGHQGGVATADGMAETMRFRHAADYRTWLARMAALPVLIDQTMALMREGAAAGLVPPRVLLERVPAQLDAQLAAEADVTKSPFWRRFARFPDTVSPAERAALQDEARRVIGQQLVPAYRRLKAYLTTDYLPKARASIAATDRPDAAEGRAYYDFLARYYTSTPLSAAQIHDIGLQEVARLRAAMERVKAETGFQGTLAEFYAFLRSDPRFFHKTPAELLAAYQALSKRIDPELVKVVRTQPRLPYGVRAIPDNIAPDTTTAYYQGGAFDGSRPGWYYVNLYKPETRPTWEMLPLSLHEAVPGHHFQFARALEMADAPLFRKTAYFVAYGEGWALYAEQLGHEMGLYDDPYDRFGQLTYEMWRAVRLVVDTGMHAMGWSRERAIAYFKDNAAKTEQDIVNEIDRYIGWPGQALAYKIGQLEISRLRAEAERALGPAFDLRDFNDALLETGSVPLTALRSHITRWISQRTTTGAGPR